MEWSAWNGIQGMLLSSVTSLPHPLVLNWFSKRFLFFSVHVLSTTQLCFQHHNVKNTSASENCIDHTQSRPLTMTSSLFTRPCCQSLFFDRFKEMVLEQFFYYYFRTWLCRSRGHLWLSNRDFLHTLNVLATNTSGSLRWSRMFFLPFLLCEVGCDKCRVVHAIDWLIDCSCCAVK